MDEYRQDDRRKDGRHPTEVTVRFSEPSEPGTHSGTLINLSEDGAYIASNQAPPLRTRIRIEGPGFVYHATTVRVFWVEPERRQSQTGGFAVRILDRQTSAREVETKEDRPRQADIIVLPVAGAAR